VVRGFRANQLTQDDIISRSLSASAMVLFPHEVTATDSGATDRNTHDHTSMCGWYLVEAVTHGTSRSSTDDSYDYCTALSYPRVLFSIHTLRISAPQRPSRGLAPSVALSGGGRNSKGGAA
jgi:hypothetical protein